MTYKFEELMNDDNINADVWEYYDIDHDLAYVLKTAEEFSGQPYKDIDISTVVYKGGYEGGGESVIRVYKIVDHVHNEITYIRRTGCYYSYDGIEWDDTLEQVYPKSIEVIVYQSTDGSQYDEVGDV